MELEGGKNCLKWHKMRLTNQITTGNVFIFKINIGNVCMSHNRIKLSRMISTWTFICEKTGVNVDKYENFEKKRHFGSFNIFLGIQLRDMTVKCQNRVDNGMGYTFQQQWESTKLKILSWTGVNIAKNTVF